MEVVVTTEEFRSRIINDLNTSQNNDNTVKDHLIAIRSVIRRYMDKEINKREFLKRMEEQERLISNTINSLDNHIKYTRYCEAEFGKINKLTIIDNPKQGSTSNTKLVGRK